MIEQMKRKCSLPPTKFELVPTLCGDFWKLRIILREEVMPRALETVGD